jgi:hypothetical protein
MDRKDFFRSAGRFLLLGGIIGTSGYLVVNKRVTSKCTESPICMDCGKLSKCKFPQAKEVKNG